MTPRHNMHQALEQVLNLNQAFCDAIVEGDWQNATDLERQRREALQRMLSQPIATTDRNQVINTLKTLLETDRELVEKLADAREHCSQQISRMHLGRQASQSYESTGLLVAGPRMMQ